MLVPSVGTPAQVTHHISRARAHNTHSSLAARHRPMTAGLLATLADEEAIAFAHEAEAAPEAAAGSAGAPAASPALGAAAGGPEHTSTAGQVDALRKELEELKAARRLATPAERPHVRRAPPGRMGAGWDARMRAVAGGDPYARAAPPAAAPAAAPVAATPTVPDGAATPVAPSTAPDPSAAAPSASEKAAAVARARVDDEYGWSHDAAQIWRTSDAGAATVDAAASSPGRKLDTRELHAQGKLDDGVAIDPKERGEMEQQLRSKLDFILEVHREEKPMKLTRFESSLLDTSS